MRPGASASSANDAILDAARLRSRIDDLTLARLHDEPAAPATEIVLLGRVLVGVGADEATAWAIAWADALAPIFAPHVTLVRVEPPFHAPGGMWGVPALPQEVETASEQEALGARLLANAATHLREIGLDVTVRQTTGRPRVELAKIAEEEQDDLIIVGSPPRTGLERLLLGSVAEGVEAHARTNVLLAKSAPVPGDILCAVDGSPMSQRAATLALRIARAWGATLHVLHVAAPDPGAPPGTDAATLRDLRAGLGLPWREIAGVEFDLALGDPARRIIAIAEEREARLVVLGDRGVSGLRRLVTGSVAHEVARHAPASVLLVR